MIAEGNADICVQLSGGPWDFAALAVIVEAAGGSFSYFDGSPSLRPKGRALFTNGNVHAGVLVAVQDVDGPDSPSVECLSRAACAARAHDSSTSRRSRVSTPFDHRSIA